MFGFLRNNESPTYRLDRGKLITFYDLDVGELMAAGVLSFLFPLLILGGGLPLLGKATAIGSLFLVTFLLYFVRRDEHNVATWIARMVPFWMRQRRFRATPPPGRVTPVLERLDEIALFGPNALSFEWRDGADGVAELHVFEQPLRPYRALVAGTADTRFVDPDPAKVARRWA